MKELRGSIIIIFASLIWGSTFVAQAKGMEFIGPHTYNASRFLLGFLVLTPAALLSLQKDKKRVNDYPSYVKKSIFAGLIIGIPEIIASALQQIGIVGTSASKAGFITAMYIVFVPLVGLFFKKKVSSNIWIAVIIAVFGFYLLSFTNDFTINGYDICLLFCAFAFAFQILGVDILSVGCNSIVVSQMMFLTCTIVSFICMFLFEQPTMSSIIDCAYPILYAGILSCGLAYTCQIIGQKDLNPTVASLLMSLESVFAAISGAIVMGDRLSSKELWGCIFIFIAVILSQLPESFFKRTKQRRLP